MRRALSAVLLFASILAAGACIGGGGDTINVDAVFKQLGDLPRFANVQASDVVIGSVRAIKLDGYFARVTLRIDAGARIPKNAEALIRSTSLLGEEFVELRPPAGAPRSTDVLKDGDTIPVERTSRIPGLDDALISLGRLLEGGTTADLATIIHSSAAILDDKGSELGRIFTELRSVAGVFSDHAPDVADAIDNLDTAISTVARSSDAVARAIDSTADATTILADQRANLDRLVVALDHTSSVLARFTNATNPAAQRAIDDVTQVVDKVMTTTGDLEKAVSALARFTDLWPRAFPGDYLQLDIVFNLTNVAPPASATSTEATSAEPQIRVRTPATSLADLLWGAAR